MAQADSTFSFRRLDWAAVKGGFYSLSATAMDNAGKLLNRNRNVDSPS